MLLISATKIPQSIREFLAEQDIEYVDCTKETHSQSLLAAGFDELFKQFDDRGNFIDHSSNKENKAS